MSGRMQIIGFLAAVVSFIGWRILTLPVRRHTVDDVLRLIKSNVVSDAALVAFRCACTAIIAFTLVSIAIDKTGINVCVCLVDQSFKRMRLVGRQRFYTFTVWAWIGQGMYFAAVLLLHVIGPNRSPPILAEAATVLFEIGLALAMLVSFIVTYVLIPGSPDPENFFTWQALAMHNLNVAFMVAELILNQVEFDVARHFHFALLYGVAYILFAWVIARHHGCYFYFFLNPNYKHALLAHIGLLVILTTFFCLAALASVALNPEQNALAIPVLLSFTAALCTFRPRHKLVTA